MEDWISVFNPSFEFVVEIEIELSVSPFSLGEFIYSLVYIPTINLNPFLLIVELVVILWLAWVLLDEISVL